MRPIAGKQDDLRYPLNGVLGTQAHVRLLRVMANEVDGPLTVSDVARRAGLTVPGAQKALTRLSRSGFVSRVGGGRKHQYAIQRSDGLVQAILKLFQAEKDRYGQLLAAIRNGIRDLTPPPQAVWIQTFPRENGDPFTLGMLHGSRHLADCLRHMRTILNQVEDNFDLTIELEGHTLAEISDVDLDGSVALYGVMPTPGRPPAAQQISGPLTHGEKDRHLSLLCRKLADSVEQDPSLVRRAMEHINRLLAEGQGTATRDLREWRDILSSYPIQRLSRFMTSSSERAERLRQSNPLLAILDDDERAKLVRGPGDADDT